MDELLSILFSMPTLPWTCLVVASVVYWLTVILGALDIDVLGGADGHGHLGDVGHADVVGHGDAGHADLGHAHDAPAHDGALDAAAPSHGGLTSLLSSLKLRSVPVTITLSFLGFFGCLVSYLISAHVTPLLPLSSIATSALVLVVSLVTSLFATSAAIRPLAPLFATKQGTRNKDLVGKVVRITTGRVDAKFGEGQLDDGGAGLRLQVRCADPDALARDDEALILGWDAQSESFEVEPMSTIAGKTQKHGRSDASSGKPT
ncbi:MAG: DUF1449 family protein [Sandaracinaceae bacterium]|nr:DUF1449 family protein [Sandaracinaceae bacterium]